MCDFDPGQLRELAVEAARLAGVRVIFASGQSGSGADGLPPEVFPLDGAPHDWLFPRTAAVVHHGGPGTAAVAIAAGRPQVICPFMADQPFWGARLHRLGLAPAPVARSALTAASLADAISSALAGGLMPRRAEALGRLVRAEDGTATAVAMLEQHLATWRPAVRSAA
jgi:sterol 3beta-glucosyltransferase